MFSLKIIINRFNDVLSQSTNLLVSYNYFSLFVPLPIPKSHPTWAGVPFVDSKGRIVDIAKTATGPSLQTKQSSL